MEEEKPETPPPDLTVYEKDSVFPWTNFTKAKIKALKVKSGSQALKYTVVLFCKFLNCLSV